MLLSRSAAPRLPAAPVIREPLTLIDRVALLASLSEGVDPDGDGTRQRPKLLTALRATLKSGREEVRRRFESHNNGEVCVQENCHLADELIRLLAEFTVQHVYPTAVPTVAEEFDICATGGYGRGELAPFSDIDLLFLLPYKQTPRVEQVVEFMLYMLWDLGLKVGHAVRSVDECIRQARSDLTIRTALLETRPLWGKGALFLELRRKYDKEIIANTGPAFVESKLAERDERHRRMGDSRYVLEPNLKDGKGGMRDLQTLFWIAKYLYRVETMADMVSHKILNPEEAQRFTKAQRFLWTARSHLHYLTGRQEDRLTFDVQTLISQRMGYNDRPGSKGVERFMKHYFLVAKDVGNLTRIFCAALEAESKRLPRLALLRVALSRRKEIDGFVLDGERLALRHERQFRDHPVDMIRLFAVAQHHNLDIHPSALRTLTRALRSVGPALRQNPEANRVFLDILTSPKDPEISLRRMNEAGILGRFLPDFGRVVAQMQYDMYHTFTVDEHTLFAIGVLHKIDSGDLKDEIPVVCEVMHKIISRRALYVAVLLHDVAKGRGGDHWTLGAKVAEKLCPRLGLSAEETETVAWLVDMHLTMSGTAFKRDLEDPRTVRDFVELVQSPERLRMLLVLTCADIRAVGPGRWNAWKGSLLRELYLRAEEVMAGSSNLALGRDRRMTAAQAALRERLPDWTAEEYEAWCARGYPAYWLSLDTETHARHARMVREAERAHQPLTVDSRIDRNQGITEITIYTEDHPGLFSRLAGALSMSGANIVDAKIFTMSNGMALDMFSVQDAEGGPFAAGEKLARLSAMIELTLSGQLRPREELAKRKPVVGSRTRVFKVPPRVLVDNAASNAHTLIEVNGRDRPGLLYEVTRALTTLGVQIFTAKIATYGAKVVDVFYVKDIFGLKIINEAKLQQIRDKLLEALTDPADRPPAPEKPAAVAKSEPPA